MKGKKIILVGHYPAYYPESVKIDKHHELINRSHLIEIIERFKPLVYLHGHKHIRWRIGNAVNCGSAGMKSNSKLKQAGYVSVQLENDLIQSVEAFHMGADGKMEGEIFEGDF